MPPDATFWPLWIGIVVVVLTIVGGFIWIGGRINRLATKPSDPPMTNAEIRQAFEGLKVGQENLQRATSSTRQQVETMRGAVDYVTQLAEGLRREREMEQAAERVYQRRGDPNPTINLNQPGVQFQGPATMHGPTAGGGIGTINPPPKPERAHTI